MEERLHRVLSQVNDWLKFAEAKNAALLAADSAAVFGTVKVLEGNPSIHPWLLTYAALAATAVALAAALALVSFLPRTRLPWIASTRRPSQDDNLLFYGDIAAYDPDSFLTALYRGTGASFPGPLPLEQDYAEQIIVNSRIALSKYRLFSVALWITAAAILTPIVAIPLLLWRRKA